MTVITKVKSLVPNASNEAVGMYLELFDEADACLANYPKSVQELTKALAIAHMLTMNNGGQVTSERTRTGASASYAVWTGQGLLSTQFGQQLNGLPSGQCVISLFSKPQRFARSVKPCL